jgi:hypothetical protein
VSVAHLGSSYYPRVGGVETHAAECSQVLADFPAAAGKVVTIPNRTRGPVMTVTYEPPRLNRIGSPHALTLTHREGSNADVGSFHAAYGDLIGDTS